MATRITTVTSDGHGGTRIVTRKRGFWSGLGTVILVLWVVALAIKVWWLMIPTVLIFAWIVAVKVSEANRRAGRPSVFSPTVTGGPGCPCGQTRKHPITGACAPRP